MFKNKRILFWIDGPSPSNAERILALACGPGVSFRNAAAYAPTGSLEKCDGVSAADEMTIPPRYRDTYPVIRTPEDLAALYASDFEDIHEARAAAAAIRAVASEAKRAAGASDAPEGPVPTVAPANPFGGAPATNGAPPVVGNGKAWKPN